MKTKIRRLLTVEAIYVELGRETVEKITKSYCAQLTNWIATGRFPHRTFLVLNEALKAHNCSAPPSLWGIDEAKAVSRAAKQTKLKRAS